MKLRNLYARKKSQELYAEVLSLLSTQVNVRMQIKMGQTNKTHLLKQIRRNIARVKTCLVSKTNSKIRSGHD
ncbi:50S ribosomal protein L29 [Blochmannia endosymbiont of Camponotus (Colobopsis) obliquus]|uniref:50S ribosomal protein L29 n=1 Tax=Blochmannia endosymbiont of Camponotus (Colobopsis) obliquus TaxID=1505597 RepID=UPI00061A6869|nr:50S ribosomal protein L29 [Blochmannia endosymbiont of Camponotus (Colobopsis) obliquus]AKC60369.1 50S ribosomal protein L29 [Blochmannia endosymbiont of Camponotus (Colobopsis) obliquus]